MMDIIHQFDEISSTEQSGMILDERDSSSLKMKFFLESLKLTLLY
jgi:hypothetical protein